MEEAAMKAISMAQVRAHLSEVVNKTSSGGEAFIIHNRGVPKAVIIGIDEYRELQATLEEMNDSEAYQLLSEGKRDIKYGRTKSAEDIFGESLL